ncbi:MAG: AbrB/MazE/SpoVT family DNA-binding domain-containing protein [Verrucomicrobiae bacterium]|nr:AbrB/MazE/SpoVT family DNA-binding domain-containing protein [Verrucomicrobiae bacterium]MDW8308156.1 AbrB/MazE/SpoVT family DNA-binding domain-containing protein [Verrucomicrobiales bacterium]
MKVTTLRLTAKRLSVLPRDWCKRQGLKNGDTLRVLEVGDALVIEPVKPPPPELARAMFSQPPASRHSTAAASAIVEHSLKKIRRARRH